MRKANQLKSLKKYNEISLLVKLNQNQVEFVPASKYHNFTQGCSIFYLLCYNEELKCSQSDLWKEKLSELLELSKHFKCAILNYKLHNELNRTIIDDSIFNKRICLVEIQDEKKTFDFKLVKFC